MAWRIVKQPNGLLARFSDVVDHFTHIDMTEAEALEVCIDNGCSSDLAQTKVLSGLQDVKPWTVTPGSGLERWEHCLGRIETVHGVEEKSKTQKLISHG